MNYQLGIFYYYYLLTVDPVNCFKPDHSIKSCIDNENKSADKAYYTK